MESKNKAPNIPNVIDLQHYVSLQQGFVYVGHIADDDDCVVQDLDFLRFNETPEVTLIINSPGGEVPAGLAIISAIRDLQRGGARVTGIVRGQAESMGFNILQACDVRIMHHGDVLMAHGITALTGGDHRNFEAAQKVLQSWRDHMASLIALRVQESLIDVDPVTELNYWDGVLKDETPVYFLPAEALSVGLVDQVV